MALSCIVCRPSVRRSKKKDLTRNTAQTGQQKVESDVPRVHPIKIPSYSNKNEWNRKHNMYTCQLSSTRTHKIFIYSGVPFNVIGALPKAVEDVPTGLISESCEDALRFPKLPKNY